MNRNYRTALFYLVPILILAAWIDLPSNPAEIGNRNFTTHLGLDLVGGVQVLLEADLPQETAISSSSMDTARQIVESRANGLLGVWETVVQQVGDRRILVELPGESDPQRAIEVIGETGQLEFVDMGQISAQMAQAFLGQTLLTDYPAPPEVNNGEIIYHTIMTGTAIQTVAAKTDALGKFIVAFDLDAGGTKVFRDYTSNNINSFLAIVLDKEVISIPRVSTAIPNGSGSISGNFTLETANHLATTLRYGSLPIPSKVSQSKTIGPSLCQDFLEKSLKAGAIGLGLVLLFMAGFFWLSRVFGDMGLLIFFFFFIF